VEPITLAQDLQVVATSNRPMTAFKHAAAAAPPAAAAGSCWLPFHARDALVGRISSGDVLLMAGPLAADRLAVATRILLRHSDHPVQSHILGAHAWKARP
jgi:hypothetical protein